MIHGLKLTNLGRRDKCKIWLFLKMGQDFSGGGGRGRFPGQDPEEAEKERKERQEELKRKRAAGPQRVGRKKKKTTNEGPNKLPTGKPPLSKLKLYCAVVPTHKSRLRLLRQERVKDYILLE